MLANKLRSLFNPSHFQGWGKRRRYFEGWYFKILSSDEKNALAIIPGVAMDTSGNRHTFIQLLDGKEKSAHYHKFDFGSFSASAHRFLVSIDNNHFSEDSVSLDLSELKGKLCFSGNVAWPNPWYSPGIMGPYSFVPFMECYHGIISMDHIITGQLEYKGVPVDFSGGRGYIEKDWGRSFPEGYIWMQSNHFNEAGVSVKASIARIPWLHSSFVGLISGVWLHDRLIRFTTYNGSVLRRVAVNSAKVDIVIENKKHRLEVMVERDGSASLASPVGGHMDGRIEESMSSGVELNLTDRNTGKTMFAGKGRNAAVEVAGNLDGILV